ncbi:MAG: metallophosphoesterase [Halioglobus sp.]
MPIEIASIAPSPKALSTDIQVVRTGRNLAALLCILLSLASSAAFSAEQTTRVAVISDINGRYGSTHYHLRVATAVERIIALQPDLVISTGDMVAGQKPRPRLSRRQLETMWTNFHQQVREPLQRAGIPLVMTPGNHDASAYPGFDLERKIYAEYFQAHPPMFSPGAEGNFPYHFSTEIDGLYLISLDATQTGKLPDTQLAWLKNQFQPGPTIVFGHLPLQPVSIGRENDIIQDARLEELLRSHGQAIYLSGHHHAYYPGTRAGINMVSMGNLGGNLRRLVGTRTSTGFSFTILDYNKTGLSRISRYTGPDFTHEALNTLLPPAIGSGEHELHRLDLAAPPVLP